MPKKMTIEDLARMVQEGFADLKIYFDKRFDIIDEHLDSIDVCLDRIGHIADKSTTFKRKNNSF